MIRMSDVNSDSSDTDSASVCDVPDGNASLTSANSRKFVFSFVFSVSLKPNFIEYPAIHTNYS